MKKNILAIDDDTDILNILSIILTNKGYNVMTDTTGSHLKHMQHPFPNLIILDISLNGYDGREICKELKAAPSTAAIPVIMFSANLDLQRISQEYKADDYLTKPFEIRDLMKKIEKFI